jgi:hypothetical protein
MRTITFCLLLVFLRPVAATTITVGATEIEIPNPPGFSAITPQMAALYEVQKHFVAPTNVQFLGFIPEKDVLVALKDEISELERRFTVQTAKALVNQPITRANFDEFKNFIKTQNDEILKKVEAAAGKLVGKINEDITRQYDIDLALSFSQMIPLPVHAETERWMAYSAFVKYNTNDEAGNPVPFVVATTLTFVHIKGKVLFLYSYAQESGLDWSRSTSKQWAEAVVKANPSDFQSTIDENLPVAVTGMDWGRVGARGLVGAFIGVLIGLLFFLVRWLTKAITRPKPG